jgi:hypothetical protein
MAGMRKRGGEIRQFILDNVEQHPKDIATLTAQTFDISRQAVNKHTQHLVAQKALLIRGTTRNRLYFLRPLVQWKQMYPLDTTREEDVVWRRDIRPLLKELPSNVLHIWQYGFTEMLNNAIDHSAGQYVGVQVAQTAAVTEMMIADNGEGIFKKIQRELDLYDEQHAVLELAKGKLTTAPAHHTNVFMKLQNKSARTTQQVFDSFTSDEEYGFTKTVIPVRLAQYGDEKLVSRSQAKRLLARIEKFKVVIFDFDGVEAIGQAFADEVFRVFRQQHREIESIYINANEHVQQMLLRVGQPPES